MEVKLQTAYQDSFEYDLEYKGTFYAVVEDSWFGYYLKAKNGKDISPVHSQPILDELGIKR